MLDGSAADFTVDTTEEKKPETVPEHNNSTEGSDFHEKQVPFSPQQEVHTPAPQNGHVEDRSESPKVMIHVVHLI